MDNNRTPRSYSTGTVKRDNRQQQQKMVVILICVVIALLLVVFSTILAVKIVTGIIGGFNNADPSQVQYQNVTIDKNQTLYGPLALVNDTHEYKFPDEATKNLANIWEYRTSHTSEGAGAAYKTSNTSIVLDGTALVSAHEWLSEFRKQSGESNATITGAFRTFQEQQSFQVPAGKSDHHTGYGITLKIVVDQTTYELSSDEKYNWLAENAYKYGFVVRYPEEKAQITGISGYDYYFHYVGYGPAKYMQDNNLCLEEFVAEIKSYSVDKPLEVTDANGQDWLIYYTACQGDVTTVQLPTNFTYTVSGDNEGGIIVCVSLSKTAAQEQATDEAAQ